MKDKLLKIINETYKEFAKTKYDSRFEIKDKTYYTDTGYAIEGIEYFIIELKEKIENTF